MHRGRHRDLDGEQFEQQYPEEMALEQAFHLEIRSVLDRAELEEHDGQEVVLRHARRAQSDAVEERFYLAIRNALHRTEVEEQNGGEVGLRHARDAWFDAEQFEQQRQQYAQQMALEEAFHVAMRFLRN